MNLYFREETLSASKQYFIVDSFQAPTESLKCLLKARLNDSALTVSGVGNIFETSENRNLAETLITSIKAILKKTSALNKGNIQIIITCFQANFEYKKSLKLIRRFE